MKYDDAKWHYEGQFPADSPMEFGGTHIALFLKWCFIKGWAGELHLTDAAADVERVVAGTLSATEFLFQHCDGKLTDEDLNDEGNSFAEHYYGDEGLYLIDYAENFADLMYTRPESTHDFSLFSQIVEDRYQSGILTESQLDE